MGKEKKEKDIGFNPTDYDYMDSMPLEGWIWEFIRRNELYRKHYSLQKQDHNYFFDPVKLFSLVPYRYYRPKQQNGKQRELPSSRNYLIIERALINSLADAVLYECFPSPNRKYTDFHQHKPLIKGLLAVSICDFRRYCKEPLAERTEDNPAFLQYCYRFVTNYLAIGTPENTLYFGISKEARREDVKKQINDLLKEYLPERKNKPRVRKKNEWKHYLMVYDLSEANLEIPQLIECLRNAFPYNENLYDEINIRNYINKATALISGNYNKYLFVK